MSSHADTIRRAIDYRSRFAEKADDAIDALRAENQQLENERNGAEKALRAESERFMAKNQRLREALAEIQAITATDTASPVQRIAREALAGDAE